MNFIAHFIIFLQLLQKAGSSGHVLELPNTSISWGIATKATQMPCHSCKLAHALLWITCQHRLQRVSVDRILDFLSLRIKISSCLPVWDAPCWPTCWVWCEMCVPPLMPLSSSDTHIHSRRAGQLSLSSSVHFSPPASVPRLSLHLGFQSSFFISFL